jgi:hypothetical protein
VRRLVPALLASLALLQAGCNGGAKALPPRFDGPVAVAVFQGYATRHPGLLHPYLAVANARADDLRFVDTEDDQVVMSPTVVFPLSVPTLEPHPARLLSVPLGTAAVPEATPGADLLLVVGAGSLRLEVVETWAKSGRVAYAVDLPSPNPGTALLSLAAAPTSAAGRARIYAGLSGGKLAVVDFQRAAAGEIVATAPVLLDLAVGTFRFEPLDLAVAPGPAAGQDRLFVATTDLLGPALQGVAQVDVSQGAAPAVVAAVGLDARAPTRRVATALLAERDVSTVVTPTETIVNRNPDKFELDPAGPPDKLLPRRRVYAYLDPSSCGFGFPISCGLATLLPDTGIVPDPMGELEAPGVVRPRTPIPIPVPDAMVAVQQADPTGPSRIGLAAYASQATNAATTGLLAIAGPDGVYFADLGRFSMANDISFVSLGGRAAVTDVALGGDIIGQPYLEVASLVRKDGTTICGAPVCAEGASCSKAVRIAAAEVTPGFVSDDTWTVTWQGAVPGFTGAAVLGRDGPGDTGGWIAFQVDSGRAPAPAVEWFVTARLDLPELGRRVGDFVDVFEAVASGATAACPRLNPDVDGDTTTGFLARIAAILPPDSDHPGGAVRLDTLHACLGDRICSPATAACPDKVLVGATIRSSGLLLQGRKFRYAGRPELGVPFELAWAPESALAGDPEQLAIAQKARRRHYPPNLACAPGTKDCGMVTDDPLANGPMLRFCAQVVAGTEPVRGSAIQFTTQAGFSPMSRRPLAAASRPVGLVSVYEPPTGPGLAERTHFYAAFEDGTVLRIAPGGLRNEVVTIR